MNEGRSNSLQSSKGVGWGDHIRVTDDRAAKGWGVTTGGAAKEWGRQTGKLAEQQRWETSGGAAKVGN